MQRANVDQLTVEVKYRAELAVAKTHGVLRYHVEHRLDIRGRGADDFENLAGCDLLLTRLCKFFAQAAQFLCGSGLFGGSPGRPAWRVCCSLDRTR